jgi:hypothetical protein
MISVNSNRMQITVPREVYDTIKTEAKKLGITMTAVTVIMLREAIKARENQSKIQNAIDKVTQMNPEEIAQALQEEITYIKAVNNQYKMEV